MTTDRVFEYFARNLGKWNRAGVTPFQFANAAAYNTALSTTGLGPVQQAGSWQLPEAMPVTLDWRGPGTLGVMAAVDAPGPCATIWGGVNITGSYQLQAGCVYVEWSFAGFRRNALLDLSSDGTFVIGMADAVSVWIATATSELVPVAGPFSFCLRPMLSGERSNARTSMVPISVQVGSPISALMYLGPGFDRVQLSVSGIVAGTAVLIVDFQTANLSSLHKVEITLVSLGVGGSAGNENLSLVVPNGCQFVNFSTATATANLTVGMSRITV